MVWWGNTISPNRPSSKYEEFQLMKSVTLTQSARLTGHMGEPCVSEDVMGPQASLYPPRRPEARGGGELRTRLT